MVQQDEFSRKLKAEDFRMTSTHRCLCFVPLPTDHPFPSFLPFSLSFPKAEVLLGEVSEHRGVCGAGLGLSIQPLLLPSPPAHSCSFPSSCVQGRKWTEFILRKKKSTWKSTLNFSYTHVTGWNRDGFRDGWKTAPDMDGIITTEGLLHKESQSL